MSEQESAINPGLLRKLSHIIGEESRVDASGRCDSDPEEFHWKALHTLKNLQSILLNSRDLNEKLSNGLCVYLNWGVFADYINNKSDTSNAVDNLILQLSHHRMHRRVSVGLTPSGEHRRIEHFANLHQNFTRRAPLPLRINGNLSDYESEELEAAILRGVSLSYHFARYRSLRAVPSYFDTENPSHRRNGLGTSVESAMKMDDSPAYEQWDYAESNAKKGANERLGILVTKDDSVLRLGHSLVLDPFSMVLLVNFILNTPVLVAELVIQKISMAIHHAASSLLKPDFFEIFTEARIIRLGPDLSRMNTAADREEYAARRKRHRLKFDAYNVLQSPALYGNISNVTKTIAWVEKDVRRFLLSSASADRHLGYFRTKEDIDDIGERSIIKNKFNEVIAIGEAIHPSGIHSFRWKTPYNGRETFQYLLKWGSMFANSNIEILATDHQFLYYDPPENELKDLARQVDSLDSESRIILLTAKWDGVTLSYAHTLNDFNGAASLSITSKDKDKAVQMVRALFPESTPEPLAETLILQPN